VVDDDPLAEAVGAADVDHGSGLRGVDLGAVLRGKVSAPMHSTASLPERRGYLIGARAHRHEPCHRILLDRQ